MGYLSAMRRSSSAFCGYTGWPRVPKRCQSTVQMALYEESELQGLPCFWYHLYNGGSKFYAISALNKLILF